MAINLYTTFQVFIAAAMLSLVYKETVFSKFSEHLLLGLWTGHMVTMAYANFKSIALIRLGQGEFLYIIPIILAVMGYFMYSKKYFWVSRYPQSLIVGVGIGISIRALIGGNFLQQIEASFLSLAVPGDALSSINNLIFIAILLSTLSYFIFTIKGTKTPVANKINSFAKYAMMAAFGYSFAATILSRINSAMRIINLIFLDWLVGI